MQKFTLGKSGEKLAEQEYVRLGYSVVGRNIKHHAFRQTGEIDLIVAKDQTLVFVEVKTRQNFSFGSGLEAVDYSKQTKLVRTGKYFLLAHKEYDTFEYRFDVAEVDIDNKSNPVIIFMNAIEDID